MLTFRLLSYMDVNEAWSSMNIFEIYKYVYFSTCIPLQDDQTTPGSSMDERKTVWETLPYLLWETKLNGKTLTSRTIKLSKMDTKQIPNDSTTLNGNL